jgi:hypothetical protein
MPSRNPRVPPPGPLSCPPPTPSRPHGRSGRWIRRCATPWSSSAIHGSAPPSRCPRCTPRVAADRRHPSSTHPLHRPTAAPTSGPSRRNEERRPPTAAVAHRRPAGATRSSTTPFGSVRRSPAAHVPGGTGTVVLGNRARVMGARQARPSRPDHGSRDVGPEKPERRRAPGVLARPTPTASASVTSWPARWPPTAASEDARRDLVGRRRFRMAVRRVEWATPQGLPSTSPGRPTPAPARSPGGHARDQSDP